MSKMKLALIIFGTTSVFFCGICARGVVLSGGKRGTASRASASSTASASASAKWVEISTLLSEYRDNEVRADSSFKDTWIQTSGYVGEVKKDFLDSMYVTLGTGASLEVPKVQCFFADSEAKKAATLSKGARVTVRGRVEGLMFNVLVRRCEFVSL